ncbi:hypothetical protein EVAR_42497_1 [Eumeta japonica]|uniref:Uncharacterized protein n=1 Tax=Eumeta variegata TaxID=151549 RepID=A0A4C1XGF7_EUMVA|nr:hypothetical protein EVAR_42497_1 [Eumeta japonica]
MYITFYRPGTAISLLPVSLHPGSLLHKLEERFFAVRDKGLICCLIPGRLPDGPMVMAPFQGSNSWSFSDSARDPEEVSVFSPSSFSIITADYGSMMKWWVAVPSGPEKLDDGEPRRSTKHHFVRGSSTPLFLRVQMRDGRLMSPHARVSSHQGYDPDGPVMMAPFRGSKFERLPSQPEIQRSCQWVHRHHPRPSRTSLGVMVKWWVDAPSGPEKLDDGEPRRSGKTTTITNFKHHWA